MTRPILMLALAACLAVACGQSNSPQSAPAGQAAPAAGPAGQPQTPESTPAATPEARPTGTSAPASNPAAPPSTSAAAQPSSAPSSEPPAPPPAPKFRELTIPAGTSLSVTVLSTLASNKSKVEDPVKGSLAKPVTVSGFTAIPSGAQISGNVTAAEESGRVKGKATIAFRFNRLVVRDEAIPIQTAQVTRVAAQDTAGDVKKGGLGAGAGAIVGGVIGGGKGAAIGAVAGGAGAVLGTKGKEVQVEPGTVVSVLLQEPVTVQVPIR